MPTALFTLLFVVSARLFGVAAAESLGFLLYNALYLLLPGVLLYRLVDRSRGLTPKGLVISWVLGNFVNIAATLGSILTGLEALLAFYPLLFVPVAFWSRTRGREAHTVATERTSRSVVLICFAFALAFSCELFDFRELYDHHVLWLAAYSNSIAMGYPFGDPFIHGVPLNYHYFFNLYIAGANAVTGLPVDIIAGRLAIHLHLVVFFLVLVCFLVELCGSLVVSLLVTAQLYLTFGYSDIFWKQFHLATATIMMRIPSVLLSFEIYIAFTWLLLGCVRRGSFQTRERLLFLVLVALAAGSRANLLPVLICALALLAVHEARSRRACRAYLHLIGTCVAFLLVAGWLMYGFGSDSSGAEILRVSLFNDTVAKLPGERSPLLESLETLVPRGRISTMLFVVIAALGRMGFLIGGLILLLRTELDAPRKHIAVFLVGVYVAGLGAISLLENRTQEQWAFYWYGDIAIAALAALGFAARARATSRRGAFGGVVIWVTVILAGVQVFDYVRSFRREDVRVLTLRDRPAFHSRPELNAALEAIDRDRDGRVLVYTASSHLLGRKNAHERALPSAVPDLSLLANDRMIATFARNDRGYRLRNWVNETRQLDSSTARAVSAARFASQDRALYVLTSTSEPIEHECISLVFEGATILVYRVDSADCHYDAELGELSRS